MKLRKITALLLCALMAAALFAGCSNHEKPGNTPSGETKYKEEIIIATQDEFTTIDPMETTAEANQMVYRSAGNIPGVKATPVNAINVYDILNCDKLVIAKDAVARLEEVYA